MAKKKRHIYLLEKLKQGKSLTPAELKELEKLEAGPLPPPPKEPEAHPGIARNQKELAMAVGKSLRTIGNWIAEGMPVRPDGSYHIATVVEWHVMRNVKKMEGYGSRSEAEEALQKIKAEKAQMELDQMKSELVKKSEVARENAKKIQALKTALLTMAKKLAARLVGLKEKEIYLVMHKDISQMLRIFSEAKIAPGQ